MTALPKQKISADPSVDQRKASNPAASVWVNASAGSGKTTILTARVTRLLLSGVKPEKILCLTYTRAGAAEMANRVTAMLGKWAVCDDNALRDDLYKLQDSAPTPKQLTEARRLFARVLSCPGGLRIRTIHSFCQEILSRFPIEAGLPPHFALIDEQEMQTLSTETLDDLLRHAGDDPQSALARALAVLVAAQGEHGFEIMLREAMHSRGRLEEAAAQAGGEEKLIAQMRSFLQLAPGDTADTFRRDAMQAIAETNIKPLIPLLAKGTSTYQKRGAILANIFETPAAKRAALFDTYCGAFLTEKQTPFKNFADKKLASQHLEIDDICAREAVRLTSVLERIESATIAETTQSVLIFGSVFAQEIAARKAARAALDYDDLIMFAEKLLRRAGIAPWILYKLDNGLDHLLVDEAQDTSRAQWSIVQALTEEFYAGSGARENANRTLFVVGDEKQSIFSFQNADPESFLSLRQFFAQRLSDTGKNLETVPMHTSFRSSPAILGTVDAVFAPDAARRGVSPEIITHTAFKRDLIGRVEIWPLLQDKDAAKSEDDWEMPTSYEEERDPQAELAQQIARKIAHFLSHKEILPGTTTPIKPGDIMILLRRRGRFADLMVRALKAQKIPVTGVDRMKLVAQLPVMDLLALIRFALLPEDDLNLASLLRGPLLGFSEEQLMQLAIGREGSLWQSLTDKANATPDFLNARDYLAARLGEADFSTPFAFLSHILSEPCPANTVSGKKALWTRLGHESIDPIEELLNEAQSFGRNHSPSLQNFLHWLTQADAEIKRELDRGNDQVRIMTVHAAKGLEAPIVFLPDTATAPRPQDIPKLQWSADNVPLFLTRKPQSGAARDLWQNAAQRQIEEYRRLLYVALTRAINRLYIGGWLGAKGNDAPTDSWYTLASSALRPLNQEHHHDNADPAPDIVYADAPLAPAAPKPTAVAQPKKIDLPDWALRRVERPAILPTSASPSNAPGATPDAAFARGRIIHRLLQSLPDIAPDKRADAAARFLAHPRHTLDDAGRADILKEIAQLLNKEEFKILFGSDSIAEAPLAGTLNDAPAFRQIDRLCLRGDEVWIVDYKTRRPPPKNPAGIPESYRRQLTEYRDLVRGIYPGKRVRCFLLWTFTASLMEIEL